jgi:hypothetical protein
MFVGKARSLPLESSLVRGPSLQVQPFPHILY